MAGLKKKLEEAKGRWAEELPNVQWAYHTTPRRSMRETPFSMTYGIEAMIPSEIGLSSMRISNFAPEENNDKLAEDLDLLEEQREMTLIRLADYQQKMAERYKRSMRPRKFVVGDLVLLRVVGSMKDLNDEKFALN